jgi:phospholipid/cholesterol/gamma-HCH transport system substrate-binding protein
MITRARSRRDPTRLWAVLGVIAVLVLAAVGYVSYTALNGLPFQPAYHVTVALPDADRLIADDDVRIGGLRVGQVARVVAQPAASGGRPYARANLALDPSVGRLPVDSTVKVRAASVLGATYIELALGHSRQTIPDGGSLPLSRATPTVDLTDLFDVFNRSSSHSFQQATSSLAGGLAGRGAALNSTIGSVSALLPPLTDVAAVLAAPSTRLPEFLRAYTASTNALAPVSPQLAGLISGGAVTFGALDRERAPLAATIDAAPATESATTTAFQRVHPTLDGLARLAAQLRPAGPLLPRALSELNTTLAAGVGPLRQFPSLTGKLRVTLSTLQAISRMPSTTGALRELTRLMAAIEQTLLALAPAQVHCNVLAFAFLGLAGYYGMLGVGQGPAMSSLGIATTGNQSDGYQSKAPAPDAHVNVLPNENAQECEAGNEPYKPGTQALSNPPGLQPDHTRQTHPPPGVLDRARAVGLLAPQRP